jgi:hypothetical protein
MTKTYLDAAHCIVPVEELLNFEARRQGCVETSTRQGGSGLRGWAVVTSRNL